MTKFRIQSPHITNSFKVKFIIFRVWLATSSSCTGCTHQQIYENEDATQASGVVGLRLICVTQAMLSKSPEMVKLKSGWYSITPYGGWYCSGWIQQKKSLNGKAISHSCPDSERIVSTLPLWDFIEAQYLKYMAHNSRQLNDTIIKHVLYNNSFPDEGIPR